MPDRFFLFPRDSAGGHAAGFPRERQAQCPPVGVTSNSLAWLSLDQLYA